MRQDPVETSSWLPEDDAAGFVEETTAAPVVSVTITPKGRCYRLAKDIIERLARVQGEDEEPEPHITLQGVYDEAEMELVTRRVAEVAAGTHPFTVNVTGLGLLASPGDPDLLHLHLHVEKSPELLDLYSRLKHSLCDLGLRTYTYTPDEWVPHLTLASGHWSRADLIELLQEVGTRLPICILPVDQIRLNRLDPQNGWRCVERFSLGAEAEV